MTPEEFWIDSYAKGGTSKQQIERLKKWHNSRIERVNSGWIFCTLIAFTAGCIITYAIIT